MPADFPNSPTDGQVYTLGNKSWVYNSGNNAWQAVSGTGSVVNVQVFNTVGTTQYTPTPGMQSVVFECWGGGGGGGHIISSTTHNLGGAGGGGGGYSMRRLTVTQVGTGLSVVVGSGGTAGTTSANASSGGPTSVGSTYVVAGGGGGGGGASGAAVPSVGVGATTASAVGDICLAGGNGVGWWHNTVTHRPMSIGGFSPKGAGPMLRISNTSGTTAGVAGQAPGGGGTGAICAALSATADGVGGAGAAGSVVATEFIAGSYSAGQSVTDTALARWNGTGGVLQDSGVMLTTAAMFPTSNDGISLGTSANKFSDIYLAAGGVINFSTPGINMRHDTTNGVITWTYNADDQLAMGTNSLAPSSNEGLALGTSSLRWSGAFVSSGINFPAAQDASADANTLDDYEEGVWVPSFLPDIGAFGGIGYSTANTTGAYTKVGDTVYIQYHVNITTMSSGTGTGTLVLDGLPFVANTNSARGGFFCNWANSMGRAPTGQIMISGLGRAYNYFRATSTGPSSGLAIADLTTASWDMYGSGQYKS